MIKMPVCDIVEAIDATAARWQDRSFEARLRTRDAVAARTGYSLGGIDCALDRLFGELRRDAIESVIRDELGALDVLDGFAAREGRPKSRALPIEDARLHHFEPYDDRRRGASRALRALREVRRPREGSR